MEKQFSAGQCYSHFIHTKCYVWVKQVQTEPLYLEFEFSWIVMNTN